MEPMLLAVDLGTTACKAAVLGRDGRIVSQTYREYPLIKLSRLEIEQDATGWWRLVKESIAEVLDRLDPAGRRAITAIALSAQGISFVPVDRDGNPLCHAFTWLDARAELEAGIIRSAFTDERLFALTGLRPEPFYTLPKIMWLKSNRPDIYRNAHLFCTSLDYIVHRLCGRFVTDYSMAGGTLMHEVHTLQWSEELMALAAIGPERLPEIAWAGTVVGPLEKRLARELEVSEELVVVLGGHDQECAGVGAGLRPGRVTVSLGTASILLAAADSPQLDPELRIPCLPSVEKGYWVLEAPISVAGAGLRWLRDTFNSLPLYSAAGNVALDYEQVIAMAQCAPAGSSGVFFYPHLAGAISPFWNPTARGVYHGISLATTLPDLARSVLEGWAFQIKTNLSIMVELTGMIDRVTVFGGAAKSGFIVQLLADVLAKPVAIAETPETALLGAGILAGIGAGVYRDVPSAQAEAVRSAGIVLPRAEEAGTLTETYRRYREIEEQILRIK